jgi:hypothetical protein
VHHAAPPCAIRSKPPRPVYEADRSVASFAGFRRAVGEIV